jgi:hypothetical protein
MLRYGFMEQPDIPRDLAPLAGQGHPPRADAHLLLRRPQQLCRRGRPVLPRWQQKLFLVLVRFAVSAADFFGLPANRTGRAGQQDRDLGLDVTSSPSPVIRGRVRVGESPSRGVRKFQICDSSEIIVAACPLPTLPRMTGEENERRKFFVEQNPSADQNRPAKRGSDLE